jgi:hypothetical protein
MPHDEVGARSSEVRVSDLLLVLVLLILSPPLLALLLFKGEAFVLKLHLLELLIALLGHLVLQHAAHAIHGESLVGISPIRKITIGFSVLFFLSLGLVVQGLLVFLLIDPLLLGI